MSPTSRAAPARAGGLAAAAALLVTCATVPPLRATDPAQAIEGAPNAAQVEVERVTVQATLGGWRGEPRDLEQRLTPVDVTIHNASGDAVRIGPEAFSLEVGRVRHRVLDQAALRRALLDLAGSRPRPKPRVGAVGGPTFPGYDSPDPFGPRSASRGVPVPPVSSWYETQLPSGTLAPGRDTSMVLFFEAPARTLGSAAFEVDLVAADGRRLGKVSMPFGRE